MAAIKTRQFLAGTTAPHVSVTEVHPVAATNHVDKIVTFNDVFQIVQGYKGLEYPNADIQLCLDP